MLKKLVLLSASLAAVVVAVGLPTEAHARRRCCRHWNNDCCFNQCGYNNGYYGYQQQQFGGCQNGACPVNQHQQTFGTDGALTPPAPAPAPSAAFVPGDPQYRAYRGDLNVNPNVNVDPNLNVNPGADVNLRGGAIQGRTGVNGGATIAPNGAGIRAGAGANTGAAVAPNAGVRTGAGATGGAAVGPNGASVGTGATGGASAGAAGTGASVGTGAQGGASVTPPAVPAPSVQVNP